MNFRVNFNSEKMEELEKQINAMQAHINSLHDLLIGAGQITEGLRTVEIEESPE